MKPNPPPVKLSLKPCPFCGEPPGMEPWDGGKPTKRMIYCACDWCHVSPTVTGETPQAAQRKWNGRSAASKPSLVKG